MYYKNFFLSALPKKMQFEVIIGGTNTSEPHLCVNSTAADVNFYYTPLDLKISRY